MEVDDCSNSTSVQELQFDSGTSSKLGLQEGLPPLNQRHKIMDVEGKKAGSKKRWKSIKLRIDSDDDEPIGSLFKLKRHRNPKKVKVGLENGCNESQKVEVRESKLEVVDDDWGGMDDTLASFRRKLKGPKKDVGSGNSRGRSCASTGPAEVDEALDVKSSSNAGERCRDMADSGSDVTMDKGAEDNCEGKVNRPKICLKTNSIMDHTGFDDETDCLRSQAASLEGQKEGGPSPREGSNHLFDEKLEDSLSAFFQKAQSGLIRKSRTNSSFKQSSRAQTLEDGFIPSSEDVPRPQYASVSGLPSSTPKSDDSSCPVYGSRSASDRCKTMENLSFHDDLCQLSKYMKENYDNIQNICSVPPITTEGGEPIDNRCVRSSDVKEELVVDAHCTDSEVRTITDPCTLKDVCHGASKLDNCVRLKFDPSPASKMDRSETKAFEDEVRLSSVDKVTTSLHGALKKPHSVSAPKLMEEVHRFQYSESEEGFGDALNQQSKGVSTMLISRTDPEIRSSSIEEKIAVQCSNDGLSNRSGRGASEETHKLGSENIFDVTSNSLSEKAFLIVEEAVKPECRFLLDHSLKVSHQTQPHVSYSASDSLKMGETGSDSDYPKTSPEDPGVAPVSSKKKNALISGCAFSPTRKNSYGHHQEKSIEPKDLVASFQKCGSTSHQSQLFEDAPKESCVPSQDFPFNDEVNGASSTSIIPDENESCPDDVVSLPDSGKKDCKLPAVRRVVRNARKRRHGDMAYEGDADWETLISEQGFLESQSDHSFKITEKLDSSSYNLKEAEIGGAAAVSAGLKARSASPIEKIKFKEVLKRKGGLQEYLECRNYILGLWSKDVSRILPITDCGVLDIPSEDEPPRTSLIREVYTFLDQRGYINVGIASKKEKEEHDAKHDYELSKEKKFEESSVASVADSEDGVAFIFGQVKSSGTLEEGKNGFIYDGGNQTSEATKGRGLYPSVTVEPNISEYEVCPTDSCKQSGSINVKLPNIYNLDSSSVDQSGEILDGGTVSVITPEAKNDLLSVQSASDDNVSGNDCLQCDSEVGRRIIIIGAGPAGLTAARHLQRQGFSVTVLEARNRIGGRVYTDHSSLSVPVDLGASIITGIEADVASERRPDPSALVCSQLGLELTVLHGFCPLYDTVTGEKVPPDLDDALQAEFNSLVDDIDLLVDQIGKEHANRMSLEDGLEYGLRRHRMPQIRTDIEKFELDDSVSGADSIDGKLIQKENPEEEFLSPLERRVMNWHFAHTEYGCAAFLKEVSLPNWNQDEYYGGFGGAHAMIKGGYSTVVESLGEGLNIHLDHVVTEVSYRSKDSIIDGSQHKVKVCTSNSSEFLGDAVLITVPLGCLKAETIKFSPPLPDWKSSSIQRLGFGVLNKVILEFPEVFWDDSVDYFGATAEETDQRGRCFMFWNVKKTVGAPVLIALIVGKAAIDSQKILSDHVNHAVMVLRKLFGEASVPDPVASVVTDWGSDPYSFGAYSYVAIGASGEDYDILGRPVENCLFFAGEATCKEHPDTVGGAMMSGLREAVRIIDIFRTGNDYTAEVETMEAAQRKCVPERDEVRDIIKRLEAVELSSILTRQTLLRNMFFTAKTTVGRLHLAKELLNLPVDALKSFAGSKEGLTTLNSWILDSMGTNGTQLLRQCVHILVRVSTDLLAVRLSGIGKTVKEKVCAHTSRDIRAIASQLVSVWLEIFRKEKACNGGLKSLRQASTVDPSKRKSLKDPASGKRPLRSDHVSLENKGRLQAPASAASHLPSYADFKKENGRSVKLETRSHSLISRLDKVEENNIAVSQEEQAAIAAAEAARAAAEAAAKAYASECNTSLQLPKIPSFHKFARREQYSQMDESDPRKKWSGGVCGRQDCISEIDSRNCRVRDWSVDFSAALNLDSSRMSVDNLSQRSHSNEIASHLKFREHSGESTAVDSSIFTRAWVDTAGSVGIKDYHAIERWQSQAAAADPDFFHPTMHIKDEEDSNTSSRLPTWKHDGRANESSISQVTMNKERLKNHPRGADRIKQAVVDYVASLLMPLYKARKIDRDGYKTIMKKTATKVMEQATDAEKSMAVSEFLDFKRKNKIRSFVDKLIERHMTVKQAPKP